MMRLKKTVFPALLFALAVLMTAMPAQAKWKKVPKVDNFILFQDYSGSMAMTHLEWKKVKIVMAKDLLQKMNEEIPELDYKGSLHTFAPFSELQAMGPYSTASMAGAIEKIQTDYPIFQRRTPMGYGLKDLRPVLDTLSGKTAIIMLSDGKHNEGIDPIEEAKSIYSSYPNVCFHVISFADNDYGKQVLETIASLNDCSCKIQSAGDLLENKSALEEFVKCALYDLVNVCDSDVIMFRSIQFDFDKSFIKDEMKPILDEAVSIINENDCNYELGGHTCSIGTEEYNQGLSERRANSVKDYLVSHGVNAAALNAVGYGELNPAHDNGTREGRRLNRRVEIKVLSD